MKSAKSILAIIVAVAAAFTASAQNFDMKEVLSKTFDTGNPSPQEISADAAKGWVSAMSSSFSVNGEEKLATEAELRTVDMSVAVVVENSATNGLRILLVQTKTGKVLACGTLSVTESSVRSNDGGKEIDVVTGTTMFDRLAREVNIPAMIELQVARFEDAAYEGTGAKLFRLDIKAGSDEASTSYTIIGQSTYFGTDTFADLIK